MELWISAEVPAVSLALTDHFNRADDYKAAEHAVFNFPLQDHPGFVRGKWIEVELQWNAAESRIRVNEAPSVAVPKIRTSEYGLNYLRVEAVSSVGEGVLKIRNLSVE